MFYPPFPNNTNPLTRNLDVFTQNKRSIQPLQTTFPTPVLFIAIGALLVGSISFVAEQGQQVKRGEDLGYFAYGGSTVIVLFPREMGVVFDEDLVRMSEAGVEGCFWWGLGGVGGGGGGDCFGGGGGGGGLEGGGG